MNKPLILIVEDNDKNLKLARDLLQYSGYQTIESTDAEGGIILAKQCQPALILMDIQLPGMSGIEGLRHLREDPETEAIPVIAVTASAMTDDEQKIRSSGFNGYIRKPIDIDAFLEEIRQIISKHGEER
jgi:two-component system cell cycle response regulator DivK